MCTIEVIVGDLLHDHEDESAVAQVVHAAMRDGLLDDAGLQRAAQGHARSYGLATTAQLIAALAGES